ncbi:uncharacterized protein LOC106167926 [Lingula anatina]|uniref:Uncharacterized protein LOC106167926 n=1 Tax=Lingula anatina TaxID=7574 RepID=A0A2R2MRY7_LINAN|nr:uncharacterized protein LOC106167926 [Lingula anatina]|eukprot:XP_023932893.1 uncharacterized protein LOC106167926 [Lingula anatina]
MDVLSRDLAPKIRGALKIGILIVGALLVISFLLFPDITRIVRDTSPKKWQFGLPTVYSQARYGEEPGVLRGDGQLTSVDMIEDLGSKRMNATDPRLLKLLREKWLLAPSSRPYHLDKPQKIHASQVGQSQAIDKLLKQRKNGFFVEAGAADGELISNSLFFERFRNWTGVLVEANPWAFDKMAKKHRKSNVINACLSPIPHPVRIEFNYADFFGGITDMGHKFPRRGKGKGLAQCFPIHSILAALGVSHVDYFSLDVEGAEMEILKTFPWKDIIVDVWTVEYGVFYATGGKEEARRMSEIRKIFQNTGVYQEINAPGLKFDFLFARKEIMAL